MNEREELLQIVSALLVHESGCNGSLTPQAITAIVASAKQILQEVNRHADD